MTEDSRQDVQEMAGPDGPEADGPPSLDYVSNCARPVIRRVTAAFHPGGEATVYATKLPADGLRRPWRWGGQAARDRAVLQRAGLLGEQARVTRAGQDSEVARVRVSRTKSCIRRYVAGYGLGANLVTLTFAVDVTMEEAKEAVRTFLHSYWRTPFAYVWVIELTKAGRPHVHLVCRRRWAHAELTRRWSHGHVWQAWNRSRTQSGAAGYVTKYVTKEAAEGRKLVWGRSYRRFPDPKPQVETFDDYMTAYRRVAARLGNSVVVLDTSPHCVVIFTCRSRQLPSYTNSFRKAVQCSSEPLSSSSPLQPVTVSPSPPASRSPSPT